MLDTVDSTNAEAARVLHEISGPTWIVGLRQTAGKGRRGRAWSDPTGNFAGTLILRPEGGAGQVALRSFVAALALRDALGDLTGRPDLLSLKWPNDVLINGAKAAGILLENIGPTANGPALFVGIGVNLVSAPPQAELESTALPPTSVEAATGLHITPQMLLSHLAPSFAAWETKLTTYGFDPIRRAFLQQAARLGEVITARTANDSMTGTFEDIDANGALVLRTAKGRISIPAADVYF